MFNGPEVPMSILFLCAAPVFILRAQLGDVQERLDFAERVLARRDERAAALPKGTREAR